MKLGLAIAAIGFPPIQKKLDFQSIKFLSATRGRKNFPPRKCDGFMRFDYQSRGDARIEKRTLSGEHLQAECTKSEQRSASAHKATRNPCPQAWPPLPGGVDKSHFKWPEIHSHA